MARLGDLCYKITDGSHNPPSGVPISEFLMLSSKNIHDGFITYDDPRYLSRENFEIENKRTQINPGDILMTIVGTVGRVTVVPENTNNICLQRSVAVIKPKKEIVLPRFLMYQIQSMKNVLEKEAKGVAQKGIYLKQVENLPIKVFERNVQESIVLHMDKICNLIELRKQQLSKLDELVKARFVELFGDPLDNTKGLPSEPFANCCLDMHQGINTVADKVEYQPSGYPIIQSKNITKGFLDLDDVRYLTIEDYEKYRGKYNPKVNDILICNIGTIGKSLVIKDEKDFLIAWNLFLVKLNLEKVNPGYIKVFVEFLNDRHYYDQFLTGGTVKFVNKKTMCNILVLMPSIEQQNQFATFIEQIDKSKFEVQQSLEKLETLKKSLMQQYFG